MRPRVICVENVQEWRSWGPLLKDGPKRGRPDPTRKGDTFVAWVARLERLGYHVEWRVLDSSHYGAPTRRRRLFVVARCDGLAITWPRATHGTGLLPLRTAAECIDWSLPCPSIFERRKPLAEKTLWRIAEGVRRYVIDSPRPFVVPGELIAPTLIQTGYGERAGQTPRVPGLDKPLGTIVGCGQKHALVAAFLDRHFGDRGRGESYALPLYGPTGTVTSRDHHALTAATLVRFNHDDGGVPLDAPMPTTTARGNHVAEVRAFLTAFYGGGSPGQSLFEPARVITAKHRLGLVTVEGADYQIADLGLRMLEPHELLRAQFGEYAASYDLSAARTKADRVRLIGNSVAPAVAAALVRANALQPAEAAEAV